MEAAAADVDAVMKKTGPDEWQLLTGGKEPQRADTDAVEGLSEDEEARLEEILRK